MLGLPTNQLLTLDGNGLIDRDAIKYLTYRTYNPVDKAMRIVLDDFENWNRWLGAKGVRWTTRFSKLLKERFDYKLDTKTRGEIGEVLQRYIEKTLYIEISTKIDWVMGGFGDGYSCFLGKTKPSYIGAELRGWYCGQYITKHPDAYAIKQFSCAGAYEENKREGLGRCFAFVVDGGVYIFNFAGGMSSSIGRLLADRLNLPCKHLTSLKLGNWRECQGGHYFYIGNADKPLKTLDWKAEDVGLEPCPGGINDW